MKLKCTSATYSAIICLASLYALALIVSATLLAFFRVSQSVEEQASGYLLIVSLGMVFYTINPVFSAIFNGAGDSTSPFKVNVVGLILNMILDPILIYGVGPFPRLGTAGAAIATVIAQLSVTLVFCYHASHRAELFSGIRWLEKPDPAYLRRIVKMGIPWLCRARFHHYCHDYQQNYFPMGRHLIAVQKIGSQIESISWMTAGGFQTAMRRLCRAEFRREEMGSGCQRLLYRPWPGFLIGVFATFLLIFAARPMFALFIPEPEAVSLGVGYLRILGVSQLAMCVEIVTAGAFIGHGRSFPSIVGISFNLLRIPGALIPRHSSALMEYGGLSLCPAYAKDRFWFSGTCIICGPTRNWPDGAGRRRRYNNYVERIKTRACSTSSSCVVSLVARRDAYSHM